MNYQTLPKTTVQIENLETSFACSLVLPYISASYFQFLIPVLGQLKKLVEDDFRNEEILKLINPFFMVFSAYKMKPPISRLLTNENIMYSVQEIFVSFNIWHLYRDFAYFGPFSNDFETLSEYNKSKQSTFLRNQTQNKFVWYDIHKNILQDNNKYAEELVNIVENICNHFQKEDGCVITLDHLFAKPVVELLFIISSMFSKVTLAKPSISNSTTFEKFLVCQNYQLSSSKAESIAFTMSEIRKKIQLNADVQLVLTSLLNFPLPSLFTNKLEDINIIFGQNQLEILHQVINLANSKVKDEKMENLQKNGIQKSTQWCEKFDIPYHKLMERPNIFKEEK